MKESFSETILELSKEDMKTAPQNPILRIYDDGELVGKFSLLTGEIIENNDLADYDIRFVNREMARNRQNWLETWNDYIEILHP